MTGSEGLIISAAGVIVGMTVRELPRIVLEKVLLRRQPKSAEPPLYVNGNGKRLELRGDVEKVFVDTLSRDILPVLNQQTAILGQIAETNSQMKDGILILVDRGSKRR